MLLTYVNEMYSIIIYNKRKGVSNFMDIKDFYTNILGIKNLEVISTLAVNSKVHFFQKGDIIRNIGDISTELYFLDNGLLRGFFLDVKGNEVTDCFGIIKGTPVVSCLNLEDPSVLCIEALENSILISIPYSILFPLLNSNIELMQLYNRLLKDSLKLHWESKIVLMQYTAAERYKWFLKNYPSLIDRVNHRYIASFLSITPVSLSRIRRAIRENEKIDS